MSAMQTAKAASAPITDGQLAALLVGANAAPDVPLPRLARESKEAASDGHAEAMKVLATPSRMLAWTVNAQDALGFHPVYVAARDGRFASLAHADDGWRIAIHDAAPAALAAIASLEHPDGGRNQTNGELPLDLAGFGALVAAADVHHEAALRAQLDRRHLPPPALSVRALERALAHGLSTGDTRWAVCAARWTAPVSLAGARGKMKDGLKALEAPEGRGLDLAQALAGVRAGLGVTALAWAAGRRRTLAHGMALASARGLWWMDWDGLPVAPHVRVRAARSQDVLATAAGWLSNK